MDKDIRVFFEELSAELNEKCPGSTWQYTDFYVRLDDTLYISFWYNHVGCKDRHILPCDTCYVIITSDWLHNDLVLLVKNKCRSYINSLNG